MMTKKTFDQAAMLDLEQRVGYEVWLLEAVYKLMEQELFPAFPDGVIYPLGIADPKFIVHGSVNINLADWRPGFLEAGAPLVFTTTFKLLDMMLEWVLEQNGIAPTYRFQQKIQKFQERLTYPDFLETRPWLTRSLIALYEKLEPLRGTIIHSRHFESADGSLRVSSSKRGVVGPEIEISAGSLRTFALLCVGVLRFVQGAWSVDEHRENLLRQSLDELAELHGMPLLGQKQPYRTTVRVYSADATPLSVDIRKVRKDIEVRYPQHACVFDVRVLRVHDGDVVDAFLFPWAVLDELPALKDANQYRVEVPKDIVAEHYRSN